jgi:hypothetical protein
MTSAELIELHGDATAMFNTILRTFQQTGDSDFKDARY